MKNYRYIGIIMFVIALVFVSDYLNFPAKLGLKVNNLNFEIWDSLIIIVVSIFTFLFVESVRIERDEKLLSNQISYKEYILKSTYIECLNLISLITSKYFIDNSRSKFKSKDDYLFILERPFENQERLISLIGQGFVTGDENESYFKIRSLYTLFVEMNFNELLKVDDENLKKFESEILTLLKFELRKLE